MNKVFRVFVDTCVYVVSHHNVKTNSHLVVENASIGKFIVVQSDYLYEEVMRVFKKEFGKDDASNQRILMLSFPFIKPVPEMDWRFLLPDYEKYITDHDDLPHICTYFAGNCDFFVTNNRRLTQMKIKDLVNFKTPKKFAEDVLEVKGYETIEGV